MTKRELAVTALLVASVVAGNHASAADGCGAGLYRDRLGRCHFYQAAEHPSHACAVGFIWRNGRCRQNVENDPFVSTWPNAAPR